MMNHAVIAKTMERFAEKSRGERNPHLLPMAFRALVTRGTFADATSAGVVLDDHVDVCLDPVARMLEGMREAERAGVAFLGLVSAEYGVGKTEFVHYLHARMEKSRREGTVQHGVLPIDLAMLRADGGMRRLSRPTSDEEFLDFLLQAQGGSAASRAELMRAVKAGEIVLLLDGLDELILERSEHLGFFAGIEHLLLAEGARTSRAQICLTARTEYLMLWGALESDGSLSVLQGAVRRGLVPHFFRLLFLDAGLINAYLVNRLTSQHLGARAHSAHDALTIARLVASHRSLSGMLKRTLHLRIFCDLVEGRDANEIIALLKRQHLQSPTALLTEFMRRATGDMEREQRVLTSVTWDFDALCRVSLDVYAAGRSVLGPRDARAALAQAPREARASAQPAAAMTDEEVLCAVHKCPFLLRSGGVLEFSHQIFLDYCVAHEIAKQARIHEFKAFNETVFTVQMREFVRGLMDRDAWYGANAVCFGITEVGQWAGWLPHEVAELRPIVVSLLDFMTTPEFPPKDLETSIDGFFALAASPTRKLHPRFRAFAFEAVAVWMLRRWANRQKHPEFAECLQASLEEAAQALSVRGIKDPEGWLLLLDQVLDIAERLRMDWADAMVAERVLARLDGWFAGRNVPMRQRIDANARALVGP